MFGLGEGQRNHVAGSKATGTSLLRWAVEGARFAPQEGFNRLHPSKCKISRTEQEAIYAQGLSQ